MYHPPVVRHSSRNSRLRARFRRTGQRRKRESHRFGPCVGFIYTPGKAKFDSTLNGLGPSGLYGERLFDRECVDDFDTARVVGGPNPGSDPRRAQQLR
jgi:hypothetical protein